MSEPDVDQKVAFEAMREKGELCLAFIRTMKEANQRIADLAQAGDPVWSQVAAKRYNKVCHERTSQATGSDVAYMATLRASDDLKLVCDTRWRLGEAVDVLRERLARLDTIAAPYDDFERFIRQSITRPDRSPVELAEAIDEALKLGDRAVAYEHIVGTLFDRMVRRLKDNPVSVALYVVSILVAWLIGTSVDIRNLFE